MSASVIADRPTFLQRASRYVRRSACWSSLSPAAPAVRPKLEFGTGSVQSDELPLLRRLVEQANARPGPIIEIGTLFGMTTLHFMRWKTPEKRILTVDNYCWNPCGFTPAEHLALTSAVLTMPCELGEIQLVRQSKDEFYRDYRGQTPALVFLDADHTYAATRDDLEWARGTGCELICGHDYAVEFPGVTRAVDEAGGTLDRCGTVWQLRI